MKTSIALLTIAFACAAVRADEVDYARQVKAVLRERCFACHGALKQKAGLRLDTAAAIQTGGESGAALTPGDAKASLLVERITSTDASYRMPPEGQPLTAEQIAAIAAWIDQGAAAPAEERPDDDPLAHWAFQAPVRPAIPTFASAADENRLANPIDDFLAAERASRNLVSVPPVERGLLLRRVYLDLIGLPPTRDELHAFLSDERPDAYDLVVERLLASPQYGERWGRHWLDIWRYSDWFGLGAELRNSQKHIWHWRDWTIESLNADHGYDRMVREMLAADEIAPTDREALRATGFLARNYFLFNRTTWLDDTIEHTSKAFLGLTLNCAKCHDHKYDPLTHEDYYRMRAIFEPHQVRLDPLPGETDLERDGLPRVFDAHGDAPTYVHLRGDEKRPDKEHPIPPGPPAFLTDDDFAVTSLTLPPEAHDPSLQQFVVEDQVRAAERTIAAARTSLAKTQQQLAQIEQKQNAVAAATSNQAAMTGEVFLRDEFAAPNEAAWETSPGEWKYGDGRLSQSKVGAERAWLRSRENNPADFEAVFRFRTLGGEMWKSVGLSFDVTSDREKLVYLSAVTPGSKLQISYNAGSGHAYPPEGMQARPVALGETYELTVRVRERLVNVALNGQHALAYRLPVEREAGKLDLLTYDAAAEFVFLEVRALPPGAAMIEAGANSDVAPLSLGGAKLAVAVSEKTLAAAELYPAALNSAHAADLAKSRQPAPENLAQLISTAALAARTYELARAEEKTLQAEQKLQQADDATRPQAEKDLPAAREAAAKAKAALDTPGEQYTSFQASLKAREGPTEDDATRRQPYPASSTGRRTALAQWITRADNPLTARVAVNHIWTRHFGQPLVETVTDFGRRAPAPAQQKLLDWLATEFVSHDWSMKHLHRLMVTSDTFRLGSSTVTADSATAAADPENRFYWRRQPVRMESETIRDSLLQLAGALNPTLGGPTIDPKGEETVFRRSLYFTHSRDEEHAFLSMFDAADIQNCYRRSESIIPQQALTLANSKLSLSMARRLAAKIVAETSTADDDAFIAAAYETLLCVPPTPEELAACRAALAEMQSLLQARNHPQPAARARENLVHALLNHNDFITIR